MPTSSSMSRLTHCERCLHEFRVGESAVPVHAITPAQDLMAGLAGNLPPVPSAAPTGWAHLVCSPSVVQTALASAPASSAVH